MRGLPQVSCAARLTFALALLCAQGPAASAEAQSDEPRHSLRGSGFASAPSLANASENLVANRSDLDLHSEHRLDSGDAVQLVSQQTKPLPAECLSRKYAYFRGKGTAHCFAQLSGNPGVAGQACECPQGCGANVTWGHASSVTFEAWIENSANRAGCSERSVLITTPRSYFRASLGLRTASGGRCTEGILAQVLADSWRTYQSAVQRGSVHQCIHQASLGTQYFHLHTFCEAWHGLFIGHCVQMRSESEAPRLAREMARRIL
uniref:Uncharacterized protein n=1 Tax=Zooxanthella nutricula TaxID=1333877 RepID=A0A7S2QLJ7_9DINO